MKLEETSICQSSSTKELASMVTRISPSLSLLVVPNLQDRNTDSLDFSTHYPKTDINRRGIPAQSSQGTLQQGQSGRSEGMGYKLFVQLSK